MQIALMDPGQVIRPQQVVVPNAPTSGSSIMAPGTPVRVDPNGAARIAARDRILRRQKVQDAELARKQKIEDAILARRQKIEDDEYERQIEIDDAAYDDEKYLRDQKYKDDRSDKIARIKRAEEISDDVRDRGRELADLDDTREYNKGVLEEQRGYDAKLLKEKNAREDQKEDLKYRRGAAERNRASEKHDQWMKESKARLEESKQRQETVKRDALFNTKKLYAEYLDDVATNKETTNYRQKLDEIIENLSIEEEVLQNYAIEKTIGALNGIIKIYLDVGLDGRGDEWLESLFSQNGIDEVSDISQNPNLQKQIAFSVMSQVEADPTIAMEIAPLSEVKTAIEIAARDQKELVEQMKQFQIARSKVSNKATDPEAVEIMKKAFRTRIGVLGEDAFEEVEAKTSFDEDGKPRGTPSKDPTEGIDGESIAEEPPEVTKKDTKAFLDDLGDSDPMEEAIKDTETIDESNSSAVIKPAAEDASTFLESNSSAVINPGASSFINENATDDDNMTEPIDESKYNSMLLNAGSAIGDGVDALGEVIDRSGIGDAASNAIKGASDIVTSPEGMATLGTLAGTEKGRQIVGQAGQTLKDVGGSIANTTITPTGSQYATDELKNLQGVLNEGSDDLVEKPVKQVWTDPETGLPAGKGTKGAVPSKVNRLQPEGIANKANEALKANGSKPFMETPPAPEGNAKSDLKARAEWQLRLRDHVNTQVQESRKALGARLKSAAQSMAAKGSRVKGKVPSGVLDVITNVAKGLFVLEVAYLGKDFVEWMQMEDPELLADVKAHEPLEAAREQVQADLNATAAEAQELVQ